MKKRKYIEVVSYGKNPKAATVRLPAYKPGTSTQMIRLDHLVKDYHGPMVNLDFNHDGVLIAIEIVVFDSDLGKPAEAIS